MPMFRYLFIVLAIWIVAMIIRHMIRQNRSDKPQLAEPTQAVRCKHCGLHIPEKEAVHSGKDYYCSEQHRVEHLQGSDSEQ